MTTTMRERKVTNKFKVAALSLASAGIIGGGALAYGANTGNNASATPINANDPTATAPNTGGQDALIISATDYYLANVQSQQNLAYMPQKVYDIQTNGNNARVRLSNTDSGSIAYLHYTAPQTANSEGMWSVVYAGQTTVTQGVVNQYGMPQSWVNSTSW